MTNPTSLVILMIDDSQFFVRHVERMCVSLVTEEGGAWATAQNPAEGLAQAARLHPDVVLLDPAMHPDENRLASYCRELAAAVAPTAPALLFLHSPLQRLEGFVQQLAAEGLHAGALNKPFGAPELLTQIAALLRPLSPPPSPTPAMPDPSSSVPRFSWLTATAEVLGHAHVTPEGTVLEWSGGAADQGPHGALVYLQNLANLCGESLGLGAVSEVYTYGPAGSALCLNLGAEGTLNVLASPRAGLRAIAARVTGTTA